MSLGYYVVNLRIINVCGNLCWMDAKWPCQRCGVYKRHRFVPIRTLYTMEFRKRQRSASWTGDNSGSIQRHGATGQLLVVWWPAGLPQTSIQIAFGVAKEADTRRSSPWYSGGVIWRDYLKVHYLHWTFGLPCFSDMREMNSMYASVFYNVLGYCYRSFYNPILKLHFWTILLKWALGYVCLY